MKKILNYKKWDSESDDIIREFSEYRYTDNKQYICNAPFTSMFFRMKGAVNTCCYNTIYELGSYPEMTPIEIWHGKKAELIREYFRHNDMSLGCSWCKTNLINRNFRGVNALDYDVLYINKELPSQLEFELNNTCNLECIMCSSHCSSSIAGKNQKSCYKSPYDESFVKLIEPLLSGLQSAKFAGGEPFLIEIYFAIWDKIITMNPGCKIFVQTNGSILNNKIKDILERGNFIICISLDSIEKHTYEKIRVNNNFTNFMNNISWFSEYSQKRSFKNLYFTTALIQQNWQEAGSILDFFNKHDFQTSFCPVIIPQHCSLWNVKINKLQEVVHYFKNLELPESTVNQINNKYKFTAFYKQLENWLPERQERGKQLLRTSGFSDDEMLYYLKNLLRIDIDKHFRFSELLKNTIYERIILKLDMVLEVFSNSDKRKVMNNLFELPFDYLISGLETEDIERIVEACRNTISYYNIHEK